MDSRIAIVTGASMGIGKAVAARLAREGYRVALLDLEPSGADVARDLCALGHEAWFLPVDVSDEEAVASAHTDIRSRWGPAACVVNNAGIFPRASALEIPLALWNRVLAVNLTGTFLVSRTFAPDMLEAGEGVIVNLASGRAFAGAVQGSHYAASKAGIVALTKSLASEWAPHIRVNAVVPGITDTAQPRAEGISDDELYARGRAIPLGRIGQPEDVAGVVAFLSGDDARYITGQAYGVNGGAIMR